MTTATRETWIDALKGWGMILIVVGHVWSLSDVPQWYMWIFSFHVPLFFFAAGLTFKPGAAPLGEFLRRRLTTLLLPYLVYALLGYVFYVLGYAAAQLAGKTVSQFGYGLWWPLLGVFYGSVGDGLLVNSPLWFLPALFVAQALVHVIHTHVRLQWQRYALLLALFAIAAGIEEDIKAPFSLLPAMAAAVFIQMGLDWKRTARMTEISTGQRWFWLVVLAGLSLLSPINGAVGLAGPTVNQPVLFLLFALIGIGLSLLFVQLASVRIQDALAFIGRHSMGILVLHMLAIKGVKVVLSIGTGTSLDTMEHSILWGLLVLCVASLLMWPAIAVIERWLPWTLGNRRQAA
ncbi:acyltransferase family protein [Hydrogenophaga sp.]|uniref:acyltransferase family protein n=1 Tax=Hydrogenophaga sp. TaxID=1904254 RepID=UPI0035AE314E